MRNRDIYIDLSPTGQRGHAGNVYQFDHGMRLNVTGLPIEAINLPQFQFSNADTERAYTAIPVIENNAYVVQIPDVILMYPKDFVCYIYQEGSQTVNVYDYETGQMTNETKKEYYGVTQYVITFNVIPRKEPSGQEYTPYQISNYDALIGRIEQIDANIYNDLARKADIENTILTTTLSRGRKNGSLMGTASLAFGESVEASAENTVATGISSTASAEGAQAHGRYTLANLKDMQAYGVANKGGTEYPAWVAGTHYKVGDSVKYDNKYYECVQENTDVVFVPASWVQIPWPGDDLFVVGNGTSTSDRSNAITVKRTGDVVVGRVLYVNENEKVATESYVDDAVSNAVTPEIANLPVILYAETTNFGKGNQQSGSGSPTTMKYSYGFTIYATDFEPKDGDLLIVKASENITAPDPDEVLFYSVIIRHRQGDSMEFTVEEYVIHNLSSQTEEDTLLFKENQLYTFRYLSGDFWLVNYSSGSSSGGGGGSSDIQIESFTNAEIDAIWDDVFNPTTP